MINPRILLRGLLLIGTLVIIGYLFEATHLFSSLNERWIDNEVRNRGITGELLFIGVGTLCIIVGLPRQMVCFLSGYAFGLVPGTLLGLLVSVLGCCGAFFYARLIGRALVRERFAQRIRRFDDFMQDNTLNMTLLIRLLPVGSNLVTNLVAGVASVRALPFFAGSALGYIPQTVVFALVGSGITIDPGLRIGLGVLLFIVSGAIGVSLYRKYRHGKSFDDEIERELETETDQV